MGEGATAYIFFVYSVLFLTLHRNRKMFKLFVKRIYRCGARSAGESGPPGIDRTWSRPLASTNQKKPSPVATRLVVAARELSPHGFDIGWNSNFLYGAKLRGSTASASASRMPNEGWRSRLTRPAHETVEARWRKRDLAALPARIEAPEPHARPRTRIMPIRDPCSH
jgi:hypothetical protein